MTLWAKIWRALYMLMWTGVVVVVVGGLAFSGTPEGKCQEYRRITNKYGPCLRNASCKVTALQLQTYRRAKNKHRQQECVL